MLHHDQLIFEYDECNIYATPGMCGVKDCNVSLAIMSKKEKGIEIDR